MAAAQRRLRWPGVGGHAGSARHASRAALGRTERCRLPVAVRRPVAALRNRIETTTGELTERLGLARHGAKTCWSRLIWVAATILAHTLRVLGLV